MRVLSPGQQERVPLLQDTCHRPAQLGPMEISKRQRTWILCGLWTATFLSALNTTLVATLVASIASEFKSANQASWLGASYLLATSSFTPMYGRLCNVLGRRGASQLAIIFCGLGTCLCGFSTRLEVLIASRFLAGIGGGGIFTTASICTSDMYSMRDRSLTQGYASIFTGLGMGLGGPLGGYISDKFGWRWAFLVQAPFFLAAFIFVTINLNYATPGRGKNTLEVLKRIDYYGCFTLLFAVGSCLLFLSLRYNQNLPFNSPSVLISLVSTITFSLAFILVELLVAPEPMMAPGLLRQRVPVLVGASNLVVAVCNFAVQYHFPMWFETVQGTSSTIAGLHLMPNSVAMSLGSVFAGYMMHCTGRYKTLNVTFGILPTIAAFLIARLRRDSYAVTQWISIIPLGFGNAVVLQTTLIALLASIPHSQLAVGTGFTILFRGIGQVLGVAVASALFQSLLDSELRKCITGEGAGELIMKIRHSYRVLKTLPEDQQQAARGAYAISLHYVFLFAAIATLTSFIIRLGIPELSLDTPRDDESRLPIQTANKPTITHTRASSDDDSMDRGLHEVYSSDDEMDDEVFPIRKPAGRRLSTYENENGFDPVIMGSRVSKSI